MKQKGLLALIIGVCLLGTGAWTLAQEAEPIALTIMHTNDVHAHHEPNSNGDGGAARQATVVSQIRAEGGNTLLLDGGDRFTGTLFHVQYLGMDSAQIMNAIGYDAMTLGNHEFDNGDVVLAAFIDALEFPVVTANVDFSQSADLAGKVQPYVMLDVAGEQVGIIGLVVPETEILSSPGPDLVFRYDLDTVAQSMVDELTAMGVNKIILLTHIGYAADVEVAQAVSGVDVVVGGHTNTFLSNVYAGAIGEYPTVLESASGEPVLVVQASTATLYLGRLDVEFDENGVLSNWGGDAILLSRYISPDPAISDLVAGLAEPLEALRTQPVGESAVFLVGDRRFCRVEECNLGNLITDAMRAETGAAIAITNGGGIRADIDEGTVTVGEVLEVLPFGNLVSTFDMAGADIVAALENGVSQIQLSPEGLIMREGAAGRFPQVSGISFTFDPTKDAGSRIVEVLLDNGEALDPEATYSVVSNDFMRRGGDAYEILATDAIAPYDFGKPLDQVLMDYIEANQPIAPEVEGRITATVGYVE